MLSKNPRIFLALYKKGILPIFAFFLISSVDSAWSYDNQSTKINYDVSRETLLKEPHPSSFVADICKPLLVANHSISPNSATNRYQRTASKITALGIILGARFAVEPQTKNSNTNSIKTTSTLHNLETASPMTALSIAAFRKCQKEYILNKVAYIK